MQPSNFGHVNALLITDFKHIEGTISSANNHKFVLYTLLVEGHYRFLHPNSYFHGKPSKFNVSPAFKTYVRYRDLYNMHTELSKVHTGLPEFPPKRWFGHRSERFVCRRINLLNEYFRKLMLREEVKTCESLLKAIQPSRSLDIMIVGPVRVGKARFIKRFLHYRPMNVEVASEYSGLVNHITSRTVSSLYANESSIFSEIEQFTPIDLIVGDWLVRVNSILIVNLSSRPTNAELQQTELEMKRRDGAVIAYDIGSEETRETAQRLIQKVGKRKCMELGLATSTGSEEAEAAYFAMSQFLQRLL
jgi:hypothetical protein